MLTRSVSHLAFGKDDVSCLDMPTRHTRTSRGTEASALLRCRGRDGKRLARGAEAACLAGALSRQIRDLEDEIGFSLLERTAKSLRLTDAGRAFLDNARALLQNAEEAVKKARAVASAEPTELHVGYSPTPAAEILPKILRAF